MVKSFRDLVAWQKGMELAETIYRATTSFPGEERFGLTAQLRRAAVSVPSNIAEGQQRSATQDYIRFLRIARGSAAEMETQLILAQRLGFGDNQQVVTIIENVREVSRIIQGLIRSLQSPPTP